MKKHFVLILAIAILSSCSSDEIAPDNTKAQLSNIRIRLSNVSTFNFDNIVINTSTGYTNYGNLDSMAASEYKNFELAYSYASVGLVANGKTYSITATDYVGEKPLNNGDYTYQLNLQDEALTIVLVKD